MDSLIDLVCPTCKSDLVSSDFNLECRKCERMFPVQLKIPRFVPEINYTNSFGLQWNRFVGTQLDSAQGTNRSRDRFMSETQWTENDLSGKFVLDAGCGAGRFSEIALSLGAKLIGVDFSSSTNAAASNLNSGEKLIIQSDLSALPLKDQSMDFIYCIGVLQHTSAPETIVKELFRCLKIGGEITLTFYENSSWHVKLYSKYLIRPITKRIPSGQLLKIIDRSSCFWFPVTSKLFALPAPFSRIFRFIIPVANYVEFNYRDSRSAREEAILDTFDMLSPRFDRPIKKTEVLKWLDSQEILAERLNSSKNKGTMRFKRVS